MEQLTRAGHIILPCIRFGTTAISAAAAFPCRGGCLFSQRGRVCGLLPS
jgi:hypothetical protein